MLVIYTVLEPNPEQLSLSLSQNIYGYPVHREPFFHHKNFTPMLVPFLNSCIMQLLLLLGKLVKNWIDSAHFENIQNGLLLRGGLAVSAEA